MNNKFNKKLVIALSAILVFPTSSLAGLNVDNTSNSGKFYGSAQGRNDIIKLEVEIEEDNGNKIIKSITPINQNESDWAWELVYPALTNKIIENNGTDGVDTITHSTISSEAILKATEEAIRDSKANNSKVKEKKGGRLVTNESKVGTFTSKNRGFVDDVVVTLIIDEKDGQKYIRDIKVSQNESRWKRVEDADFINKLIQFNGTEGVDNVTGATVTSRAIKNALNRAIDESMGIDESFVKPPEIIAKSPSEIFGLAEGTKDSPYIIDDELTFINFARSLDNYSYDGKYIKLNCDIRLEDEWIPAGNYKAPFEGEFDGSGHKVSNIIIGNYENPRAINDSAGLFSSFGDNAYVHDLKLDFEANVTSNNNFRVGSLVGYNYGGKIEDIEAFSIITAKSDTAKNIYVGGIVGENRIGKIINCNSNVSLRGEVKGGLSQVGGLVGINNRGLIANSLANGKISATADRVAEGMPVLGGIVATNGGTIVNNFSNVIISSDVYSKYLGTISGWVTGISDNYQNYTREKRTITVDSKNENKREFSVPYGFMVGTGINENGEKSTGSVILDAKTFNDDEIKNGDLTKKLNDNIENSKIDVDKGGRLKGHFTPDNTIYFRKWYNDKANMLLSEEKLKPKYDPNTQTEILELIPKEVDPLNKGIFFGRSKDKLTIVKIEVDDNGKIINIDSDDNFKAEIVDVLNGIELERIENSNFKEAMMEAVKKSKKYDTSDYSKADLSYFNGEGTKENPFRISNEEQLKKLSKMVNAEENLKDKYFSIENDITLSNDWVPVGSGGKYPFSGHIDGNGYSIKNMKIGSKENPYKGEYVGLFSEITGTIKNLKLENYEIYVEQNSNAKSFIGPVAAYLNGRISNTVADSLVSNGKIYVKTDSGLIYAGGLFAQTDNCVVQNSKSNVDIDATSKSADLYAAGVVGLNNRSAVYNNIAKGNIKGSSSLNRTHLGGIAGYNAGTLFSNFSSVNINSTTETGDVGAVAGRNTGIGFMYNNLYDDEKTIEVANNKKQLVDVGVIVNSTTEIKNDVKDNFGITNKDYESKLDEFINNKLLIDRANRHVESLVDYISLKPHNQDRPEPEIKIPDNKLPRTEKSRTIENNSIKKYSRNYDDNISMWYYPSIIGRDDSSNNTKKLIANQASNIYCFTDISDHWAKDSIQWGYENGVVKGISETTFAPDKAITRGEFVTLLFRISNDKAVDENSIFTDLDSNAYYFNAVNWAFNNQIAYGYEDGTFKPNEEITREQIASIIARFIKYKKYEFNNVEKVDFKDKDNISDWAKESLNLVCEYKIFIGDDGKIYPKNKATRAEVIQVLYNMDKLEKSKGTILK